VTTQKVTNKSQTIKRRDNFVFISRINNKKKKYKSKQENI